MNRAAWLVLLFAFITASSCAHVSAEATTGSVYNCITTWYGPGFNGRPTACGEIYDMDKLTAAHKTYPFGTRLKVTNPKNGKSVVVVINDRGPFVAGRELDLSRAAAFEIGALSMCEVQVEVLDRDMSYVKPVRTSPRFNSSGSGSYYVQVSSCIDPENAERLKEGLDINYDGVRVTQATVNGRLFNRVQVGVFKDKDEALETAGRLADEGYDTLLVRE